MVAYIYNRLLFGNLISAYGFNPQQCHWKKDQAPDLIKKCHPMLKSFLPDAE
jgi:hypothetical protein